MIAASSSSGGPVVESPAHTDPRRSASACASQGAVADEAGAEQWCRVGVGKTLRKRKAEPLVRDCFFCIPTVEVVAREPGPIAKVLVPAAAVPAGAARPAEPRYAHARSQFECLATLDHRGDDLVTEHERQLRLVE